MLMSNEKRKTNVTAKKTKTNNIINQEGGVFQVGALKGQEV